MELTQEQKEQVSRCRRSLRFNQIRDALLDLKEMVIAENKTLNEWIKESDRTFGEEIGNFPYTAEEIEVIISMPKEAEELIMKKKVDEEIAIFLFKDFVFDIAKKLQILLDYSRMQKTFNNSADKLFYVISNYNKKRKQEYYRGKKIEEDWLKQKELYEKLKKENKTSIEIGKVFKEQGYKYHFGTMHRIKIR